MENKFTPGPWTAGGTKPYKGNETWVFDANENLIANVRPNMMISKLSAEEAFYNAHLIAAAPDLLEACESFVSWAEKQAMWDKTDQSYYKAITAIKKALNQK